jgi:hypothetical protein
VVILDFVLPPQVLSARVEAVIPLNSRQDALEFNLGRVPVDALFADASAVFEGQELTVKITSLLNRIDEVQAGKDRTIVYARPLNDRIMLLVAGAVCLVPLSLWRFRPESGTARGNMAGYLLLVVPSYMISLVAAGFWIKLFLVHVFRVIDTM